MAPTKLLLSASVGAPDAAKKPRPLDPVALRRIAISADRAGLDLLILEQPIDDIVAASWLMSATKRVGLVSTVQATYSHPFHVARALAAMDILSQGRIGWLPVVAGHLENARAFGNVPPLALPAALDKAVEFVAATQALWDSWDADALIIDKETAQYLDDTKIRRVDFRGSYFQVMGPLNVARPAQGYPVLVQDENDLLADRLKERADLVIATESDWAGAKRRTEKLRTAGVSRVLIRVVCALDPSLAIAQHGVSISGSAIDIADALMTASETTGADGFHLVPATGPEGLEALFDGLFPELRRRNLLGDDAGTLRERLGLKTPVNPYSAR